MAGSEKEERWLFTKSEIYHSPSTKGADPLDSKKELHYRQMAANFIQEMGQKLQVTQLCINTAIVYMHRFYMLRCFQKFSKNQMGSVCLYLAAKVEEQPRKLEHVIKVAYMLQHRDGNLDTKGETYLLMTTELVRNENTLLQTLGFDLTVDHPHTHVVKTCQMVRASKDLAQTSYFLATNSLHLTTMCLMYKPTVVACVCIHLASKWGNWESSAEGKPWYSYVDKTVTPELLEGLTIDFLEVLDGCPTRLKKKIMTWRSGRDKDDEKDKDGPPDKKIRLDLRALSNSISGVSSPGSSADSELIKDRSSFGGSPSEKKVRFKLENPVKVIAQSDKSSFPSDSAAATNVSGAPTHTAATSASSNQKIDQRKKMHKSSVPRVESGNKAPTSKASLDRHSHIVHPHQNAPLKLTIKAPLPPCDGENKTSGKWSNQSAGRLKIENHTGSGNISVKQLHNSKQEYPSLDRMKDTNHLASMKGHSDSYLQKSGGGRMPGMDPPLQGSATSSKSHFNPNNTYSVVTPSCTTNDVQFDSTYRNSAKRQKLCDTSYKSGSKQLAASQSMRYNSYYQSSDLRLDNDKLVGHSLESNGSGPSSLHSQALSNPIPISGVTGASTSNTGGGREQFDELQLQLQQLIDIQKKSIREQRQKYAMDLHK